MAEDPADLSSVQSLLLLWEMRQRQGESLSVDELCRDCPELADKLRQAIEALEDWERLEEDACEADSGDEAGAVGSAPVEAFVHLKLVDLKSHDQGGLGIVYRAREYGLPREVALKFVRDERSGDRDSLRRFFREVAITAGLEHPGIVPVLGLGKDSKGRPCYAMRFIDGTTLGKAIKSYHRNRRARRGRVPLRHDPEFRALLRRFKAACTAVAYAHSRGIIHRDLKPANIMLGPFEETLVLDWGLARSIPRGNSGGLDQVDGAELIPPGQPDDQTKGVIGTPGFMSPEQHAGRWDLVGPASDVYSLGACLHVLLTRRAPSPARAPAEIGAGTERADAASPRTIDPRIPRALEAVCLKAMAHAPERRYGSALELAEDVERWLADEPVSAGRDPLATRVRRRLARHPALTAACAAGCLVGLLVGGIAWRNASVHSVEIANLGYANAEKTARERISQHRPGWTARGLEMVALAARTDTPLRSVEALRGLAARCLGGIDLKERAKLTSISSACLAFSPDGRRIAVGEHHGEPDYRVQIFDVASRRLVGEYLVKGSDDTPRTGVSSLAYSANGRWLAAGLRDGRILAWDTASGSPSPLVLDPRKGRIQRVFFTAEENALLSGSIDGLIVLWDLADGGRAVGETRTQGRLHSLALSADGHYLATLSGAGFQVRALENVKISSSPFHLRYTAMDPGYPVSLSGDGFSASGIDERGRPSILDWNYSSQTRLFEDYDSYFTRNTDYSHVEFSHDGALLVTGSGDNTLKVWDVAGSRLSLTMTVFTESAVYPIFSPDDRTIAVGASTGTTLYDVAGPEMLATQGGLPAPVSDFAFLPGDGQGDPPLICVSQASFDRDRRSQYCFSLGAANSRKSWKIAKPEHSKAFQTWPQLGVSPDRARTVFALNDTRQIRLFEESREIGRIPTETNPTSLNFSTDGTRLWGVLDEIKVASWTVADQTLATQWEDPDRETLPGRVGITCLSVGRSWAVAGTRAGRVHILRSGDGQQERLCLAGDPIECVAISPDEELIACGLIQGGVKLVHRASGVPIGGLAGHQETVNSVTFHPSGKILATASRDRTVALWKVEASGLVELMRFTSPSARPVHSVRFSPNGETLGILVENEYAVRLWRLDRLRDELRKLRLDWES